MKNRIIITVFTIIIASLTTYFFVSIKTKKDLESFYNIGNDALSSVNKVNGLKIIPKIETLEDAKIKILTFNKVPDSITNAVKYANYLWKNEGYYIITNDNFGKKNGKVELAKNSSESGKILKVNVNCGENDSFEVVISLINGSLLLKNNN
ncbi:hypothetical protein [Brachyspira catarrhinii]|uniref:Lipoprotein n=1 Tax=Brachyspira catarrhinii TaxID=2528966 RepID=A0ABY2TR83_9SPIR|nr:hypothetical protein [Brachyspira catarrhinii]TKZ32523.1 hypothetical protein EZH24_09180 [Brachyspira catarrhinii]